MNGYLKSLMAYIEDNRMGERLRRTPGYHEALQKSSDSHKIFEDMLDENQIKAFETFSNDRAEVNSAEYDAIFQEGVRLGIWIAREALLPVID